MNKIASLLLLFDRFQRFIASQLLVILCLPRLLCMYDILSLCAYLSVFCRLHVSLSQDYFIRFYYVYIYCNDLYLQKSKPFAFEFSEQIIKMFYICSKPVDC